jgi:DNA-binding beta-propeller fold protein YncE
MTVVNNVIRKLDSTTGYVSVFAGTGQYYPFTDGAAAAATFYSPSGIVVDPSGQIYVSDWVRLLASPLE